MQQKNEALERNVAEVVTENRHLKEPLASANNELTEMRTKTEDYDKMKSLLQVRSHTRCFLLLSAVIHKCIQSYAGGRFNFSKFATKFNVIIFIPRDCMHNRSICC